VAALFPGKERMGAIERVAFSFGLSLAVVPLIALILNYTPWGIRLEPVLYSVASLAFFASLVAWARWRRLPKEERFDIELRAAWPEWNGNTQTKWLSIALVIVIVGGSAALGYAAANPKVGERFTEFYILGLEGEISDYPEELMVGERGRVFVVIDNHEKTQVSYRIEVTIGGEKNTEVGPIVLGDEEKWEERVSFTPNQAGENQIVEFWLYQSGESEPLMEEPLLLQLDVK